MKTIQEWAKEQIILIESEQNTEYQETISLYKQLGERELQNRGLCLIVRLTILKSGIGGSTLLTFEAGVGGMEMLPQNKFRVGDGKPKMEVLIQYSSGFHQKTCVGQKSKG